MHLEMYISSLEDHPNLCCSPPIFNPPLCRPQATSICVDQPVWRKTAHTHSPESRMMDKALWPSALANDQEPRFWAQGSRLFVEPNQPPPTTERKHNCLCCHHKVSQAGPTRP